MCESSIGVPSYATLHPPQAKMLYLSTESAGSLPLERLQLSQVVIAFDRDPTGASMREGLQEDLPQASEQLSIAEDSNEDFQRHFYRLQQQFAALDRSQERSHEYEL
nr:toprim domain-containing protein [Leptolyngbya sp. FACHB-1624]